MLMSSSVALIKRQNLLQAVQTELPRGCPLTTEAMRGQGVSSALAYHYLKSGWLVRLERGVFAFPHDKLQRDACIKLLATRLSGLHVGGKTALGWRGFRHNLAVRERLVLWGDARGKLPAWFLAQFPARYVSKHLFSAELPKDFGLKPLPETADGALVSVPERALLEMLSDVGQQQGVEEARHIMELLVSIRGDVLGVLLKCCVRVKVVRLCVTWSEDLGLPWAATARKAAARNLGRGKWSGFTRDGKRLILKA
ncbi:MAG: hypothetical protein FGM15_07195 [Chthoniobacterales bacterium]|nr:hypothetical protein [Chthoniobacterales bacterium]